MLVAGLPLRLTGVSSLDSADTPAVRLWRTAAAPRDYEALSRERMRTAENPAWRERSLDMNPVEGPSESTSRSKAWSYAVYVEAKLCSDVSLITTMQPKRTQSPATWDCVLEVCSKRCPAFKCPSESGSPPWAYMQLMERYRTAQELEQWPVAASGCVPARGVASGLAVVTWAGAD